MTKESILVTGGCGFIGSEAVRRLVNEGYSVYNFDKLSYASCPESLKNISKSNYTFLQGDLFNKNSIFEFLKISKPHYILNFAAESHVDRSIDGPIDFINSNIVGTYNLLEASLDYFSNLNGEKKKLFKFIHISTDEVYGSLDFEENPFNEKSRYRPNSPYSATKASSDLLVRAWGKTYGLPFNISHSSNNYGPWQFPEKLIPLTVKNALKERPIEVYGDGLNVRDWIHVSDHIDAIYKIMLKGKSGEVYNIGGNNELSNIDIVNLICNLLDKIHPKKNSNYSDLISFVPDRPGHDKRYGLDINKIMTELSWAPSIDFSEGIKNYIEWMLENKDWLLNKSNNEERLGLRNK
tara:strand:- start:3499 stop:4551 length:1053 start_codon:yes stop_codon:yes gene_type:complete